MKPHHWIAVIAIGILSGCSLTGRGSMEAPPRVEKQSASVNASTEDTAASQPISQLSQSVLRRTPPVEDRADRRSPVRLAVYEVQPEQLPNVVIPEYLELPAPQDSAGLTLHDLEQMALARNPALGQAQGRVQALQGKWLQSGLKPNPTVGYVAEEIGDDGTAGKQGGFVSQEFVRGGKLQLNREVVSHEIARAEADLAAIQQRILTDVQLAYYDVLIAQRREEVSQDLVRIAEKAIQTSRDLFEAEEVSKAALLQSQLEANTTLILLRQAENARRAAWQRLTNVVGEPGMSLQFVAGNVEDIAESYDFEEALQRVLGSSPQLASAYADTERARWALSRAEAEVIPNVTAQVVVQHDFATGDDVTGVQIGLPLPIFNRNQGGVQQAVGDIVTAEQNVVRLELQLRDRLAIVYQGYADARIQVDKYSRNILPQAKESLALTERGFRAGEMDFLALLTAQRTYSQTNLAYLDALSQLWKRSAEINGLLLKGSLNAQ